MNAKWYELVLVIVPQRGLIHADKIDKTQPLAKNYDVTIARQNFQKTPAKI